MALDENMVTPEHMALILDDNGRQAKKRGLPQTMGYKGGYVTVEKTMEVAARMGIRYLTICGFSTEGWRHSKEGMGALIQSFKYYMVRLLKIVTVNNVRVRMIGDRTRFDSNIMEEINRLESQMKDNTELIFMVAVNYGGQDKIRRATARLAQDCVAGKADASRIDRVAIASYLDTADMSDPDLSICTSGELRFSNYLL